MKKVRIKMSIFSWIHLSEEVRQKYENLIKTEHRIMKFSYKLKRL